MSGNLRSVAAILAVAAFPAAARAQYAAGYDPQGVHVDADGVLRSRCTDPDPRLAELWKRAASLKKDDALVFLSLPRLFAEARRLADAGQPLPDEIRYLGGMTKLQYVFVYPDAKDLVIAGPAEPVDASNRYRPLGKISGRPVLHFDDLVTALRAFAVKERPDRIGCDIEMTKEIAERISGKISGVGPIATHIGVGKAADQIAEAGGPQPVKYYGVDPDTRFAFVCLEADYRLKQLALGLYPSPVAGVASYKSRVRDSDRQQHRFSLESDDQALRVSPGGDAFEIRGPSLRVDTAPMETPEGKAAEASPAAKRFKEDCNANLAALERHLDSWGDLANLSDLAIAAALITGDGLDRKTGCDLSWALDPKACPVARMAAPKSAATLCSFVGDGRSMIFLCGGVWIKPDGGLGKRSADPALAAPAARPEGKAWSLLRGGGRK